MEHKMASKTTRYQCIGGPKHKQYMSFEGDTPSEFEFIDGARRVFGYKFDPIRGVFICTVDDGPKFDIDFYAIPVPEFDMSLVVVECPVLKLGSPEVRYVTFEQTISWTVMKNASLGADFLPALTSALLNELIPYLSDQNIMARPWKEGERDAAFAKRQPPVTAEDVAEEAAQEEKGNDPDRI